jgi:hypothetical protein
VAPLIFFSYKCNNYNKYVPYQYGYLYESV